ncbi:MAG: Flp pilus assembly protein CpaB [Proteobacteria bacterium]|nr:Flp pilus assembly protein CpaB [Pseudomonadota bacterium]
MRASTIVMVGFAVVFGLIAVFLAQTWLDHQAGLRLKSLEANKKAPVTKTIVVASRPLRFGVELSSAVLREIAWPDAPLPPGAFASVAEATAGPRRVVLASFEINEPILASKITGPGQRATLAATLGEGMKAVTIRVNDVDGVAGFVLPAERVDVVLTRQFEKNSAINDVVMQNARVLAVDQLSDDRADKPSLARAITLEVDIVGAQKLALAGQVGTLSLVLRRAGEVRPQDTRRVTVADLANPERDPAQDNGRYTSVQVIRAGTKAAVYSVPREGAGAQALAGSGELLARR